MTGLFASASDNIALTYLVLYALAAGASRSQIGMMSSLVSLGGALLLLPGALLVEHYGRRKMIALITGGIRRPPGVAGIGLPALLFQQFVL